MRLVSGQYFVRMFKPPRSLVYTTTVLYDDMVLYRFYEYEEDESISKDLYTKLKKIRIWDDD